MAFELNGTKGALSWDFERMNELSLMLSDGDAGERRVSADSVRAATSVPPEFQPEPRRTASATRISKVIEAHQFLSSHRGADDRREPGFCSKLWRWRMCRPR